VGSLYHPPMRRRLFALLSALSLLLCVATCVLWVRSYLGSDYVSLTTGFDNTYPAFSQRYWIKEYTVEAASGRVRIQSRRLRSEYPPSQSTWHLSWSSDPHLGFGAYLGGGKHTVARYVFPLWWPVMVTGLMPTLFVFTRRHRNRRFGNSFCARCGYDLRATPDRCPECGTVPIAPK
jgi:hypothetical protein